MDARSPTWPGCASVLTKWSRAIRCGLRHGVGLRSPGPISISAGR
jgi:hypothetical protein